MEVSHHSGDPLAGVRMKLERAREHAWDAKEAASAFRDHVKVSGSLAFEARIDPITSDQLWVVTSVPPAPDPRLALILGDSLHHYRSALDHLAWQLVIATGNKPSKDTEFPIFNDAKKYSTGRTRRLQGMSERMKAEIDAVQPCNSKYPFRAAALTNLRDLDIIDKHRHIPVMAAALGDAFFWEPGLPVGADPHLSTGPVAHGGVIARFPQDHWQEKFMVGVAPAVEVSVPLAGQEVWVSIQQLLLDVDFTLCSILQAMRVEFFPDCEPFPDDAIHPGVRTGRSRRDWPDRLH